MLVQGEKIAGGWRGHEPVVGWDSPAGPLYPSGSHAEADLTLTAGLNDMRSEWCTSRAARCRNGMV